MKLSVKKGENLFFQDSIDVEKKRRGYLLAGN